jgi:hypothetical protein
MLEYRNVGILGFGLRLVEPTARRGIWDVGTLERFFVDIGGEVSNNEKIPSKTTFHNSTIPLFHVRGKNIWPRKISLTSYSCRNFVTFN